ncbi:sulfite exporter TauE/SafE family protein [Sulfitobacter sp. S190]|uniref:sulfite exporter TauE/SafE family protein n=1 Tax=Sulfitobacter sp. S190 TaxID=2867022 RepID=UPI0021A3E77F|nr:sulfite exporter TauE/SafE family protein [Sulfitobacter sp. S190]UWR22912.1 sulfite exporter TauE/SafE family protein [Sulfitobacter sp. S190]
MDTLFPLLTTGELMLACLVGVMAGLVKGIVGFAMPLVFISGLTVFMSPELALAGLILPTLATNAYQALRQGPRAAWASTARFRVFLISGGITLVAAAQLVRVFPDRVMMLVIGVPLTFFAAVQLGGWTFRLARQERRTEAVVGAVTGALGGLSGSWGAPTVAYLTALDTPKADQMRVQGVIYGLGAIALVGAHIGSGVLRAETVGFSAAMIPAGLVGMWVGTRVSDRIDQQLFRKATLVVLLIAGLNLLRRALIG